MADTTQENLPLALSKAQGELPDIKKDAKGNFGKYVTLDAIHQAVLPILSKHQLAWVTLPTFDESGEGILVYQLIHSSGEKIEGKMRLLTGQQTPQGQGSAITYAKRYAICAVIGITADDDDDGTAGSTKPAAPYKKTYPKREPDVVEVEKDIKDDEPITEETQRHLAGAVKQKGIDVPVQIASVINNLANSMFQVKSVKDLANGQGIELLNIINKTAKEALEMLTEPF